MMERLVEDSAIAQRTSEILIETGSYLIHFDKPRNQWPKLPNGSLIPCYCNCRYLNGYPQERQEIARNITRLVKQEYSGVDLICGLATAGIPWATQVSNDLNLPSAYVRSDVKQYGVGRLVECGPSRGVNALLVDDALFSGDSAVRAIDALQKEYEINVVGMVSIVALSDWDSDNQWQKFIDEGVKIKTLTDYSSLLNLLVEWSRLTGEQSALLEQFYKSPNNFNINET